MLAVFERIMLWWDCSENGDPVTGGQMQMHVLADKERTLLSHTVSSEC